jgi:hypothetical protein
MTNHLKLELRWLEISISVLEAQKENLNVRIGNLDSSRPDEFQEKEKLMEDKYKVEQKLLHAYARQLDLNNVSFLMLISHEHSNEIEHLYPLYRETASDVINHIDVDIERLFQTFEEGEFIVIGVRKSFYNGETTVSSIMNNRNLCITNKEVVKGSEGLTINPSKQQ